MKLVVLGCVAGTILATSACAGNGGKYGLEPALDSATPDMAAENATVLLSGARLCGDTDQCTQAVVQLYFLTPEQLEIQFQQNDANTIGFILPSFVPVGATNIVVYVNDTASNELPFTVTPR